MLINRCRRLLCLMAITSLSAQAEIYSYQPTSSSSNDEPTEQGWAVFTSRSGTGQVVNTSGSPEWYAKGVNGRSQWKINSTSDINTRASNYGWRLSVDMRVASGEYITNYYANGAQRFLPIISLDSSGNLVASLEGVSDTFTLATGSDATAYHRYDIVFHPGDNSSASFYVDGVLIKDNWQATSTSQNMIVWGNGSTGTDGEAYYRNVSFEIQGQAIFNSPDRIPSLVVSSATPGKAVAFDENRVGGGDPGSTANTNDIAARVTSDYGVTWDSELNLTEQINLNDDFDFSDPRPIYFSGQDKAQVHYVKWPTGAAQNGDKIKHWMDSGVLYSEYDFTTGNWQAPVDITSQVRERSFQMVGWEATHTYSRDISLNSSQDWSLDAKVRVYDGTDNVLLVSNGSKQFKVSLGIDSNGALVANLNGVSGAVTVADSLSMPRNMKNLSIDYTAASGQASLRLDGAELASWSGTSSSSSSMLFGNDSLANDGRFHVGKLALSVAGQQQVLFDAETLASIDPASQNTAPESNGWSKSTSGHDLAFYGWASVNPGPGHGIELSQQQVSQGSHNGRVIYPAIILDKYFLNVASVFSDDVGVTWQKGAELPLPWRWKNSTSLETLEPSESDLVELTDGRLLLTARLDFNRVVNSVNYSTRHQFISSDGGENWTMLQNDDASSFPQISGGTVDASLTRFVTGSGEKFLLFTNPMGEQAGANNREDLGLWFSFDEGSSWQGPVQLVEGKSAYSDIYQLDDDTALVVYEGDSSHVRVLRVPVTLLKEKF